MSPSWLPLVGLVMLPIGLWIGYRIGRERGFVAGYLTAPTANVPYSNYDETKENEAIRTFFSLFEGLFTGPERLLDYRMYIYEKARITGWLRELMDTTRGGAL